LHLKNKRKVYPLRGIYLKHLTHSKKKKKWKIQYL